MRTSVEALLDLLERAEAQVVDDAEVFEDPAAYRAGVHDLAARLASDLEGLRAHGGPPPPTDTGPSRLDTELRRIVPELRDLAGSRPLELRLLRVPLWVDVPASRLQLAVEHLVALAAGRAPAETPVVVQADAGDRAAWLSVEDAGPPPVRGSGDGDPPMDDEAVAEVHRLVGAEIVDEREGAGTGNRLTVHLPLAVGTAEATPSVVTLPDLVSRGSRRR